MRFGVVDGQPADAYVAIPAAAQTLTLSLNYGGNADGRKPPAPVTVTSPAKVSEVARLVAGQPPQQPPGPISCPASDGKSLTLFSALTPAVRQWRPPSWAWTAANLPT